jgi:hypothetical protein
MFSTIIHIRAITIIHIGSIIIHIGSIMISNILIRKFNK